MDEKYKKLVLQVAVNVLAGMLLSAAALALGYLAVAWLGLFVRVAEAGWRLGHGGGQ